MAVCIQTLQVLHILHRYVGLVWGSGYRKSGYKNITVSAQEILVLCGAFKGLPFRGNQHSVPGG